MKIVDLGRPLRIGYYQAKSIEKCNFQFFTNSIVTEQKLKSTSGSYKAVLGIIFHDLIAELSKIIDPIERLKVGKVFIENEYNKLANKDEYWWLEPLFSYGETSKLLTSVANFRTTGSDDSIRNSNFEVEIQSEDSLFIGRVDKIITFKNLILLQEFKSAITANLDQFIESHKEQLEFYAGIILENDKSSIVKGELFSSELTAIPVEINRDEVLEKLKVKRDLMNHILSSSSSPESLQSPSPENCISCKLKPVCKGFKDSVASFGQYDGSIMSGVLLSVSERNSNYFVLNFSCSDADSKVLIPAFHPFRKRAIVGKSYTIVNLRQSAVEFEFLKSTVIYDG